MADHDVAEENNADRDQSVEAEEERRVIFIIIIVETIHEVMWASYGQLDIVHVFMVQKLNIFSITDLYRRRNPNA